VVEEDGADVVEMAVEGEETAAGLVRPDLDLVVVTTRHEEGLRRRQQPGILPSGVPAMSPSPGSCGSRHRGRGHRALRTGQ
jgi:hypothetical protein